MNNIQGQFKTEGGGKRLSKLFKSLSADDQRTLLQFAEFLAQRGPAEVAALPAPEPIPRPESESVIEAIKRLSATYPMLDKSAVLNETSGLMSQHIMQGRPANEVIDELECLFEAHYRALVQANE